MALADMEELVARVVRAVARDYMSEALRCYHAGAFRACVVLSYIALFDDLRDKLAPLAKVNKQAKQIHQDIEKKAKGQEVFESDLANQLASAGLIDAAEKSKLDIIIQLRNKAAHPSRVHASAEEARFVFFEAIDKFLSHSHLQTTHAVDAIIAALPKGNYFPSNQISDIKDIVENDISTLHEQAIPYLIRKLVDLRDGTDAAAKGPARTFISGLAALKRKDIRSQLQKNIIVGKAQDNDYAALIVAMLRVDPKLGDKLSIMERARIAALVKSLVGTSVGKVSKLAHPLGWFIAMVEANGQKKVWTEYRTLAEELINEYLFDSKLMSAVTDAGPVHDAYFATFEEQAGSTQFDEANRAAKAVGELDDAIGKKLSEEQAFRIVTAVMKAAANNAFDAMSLRDGKFKAAPKVRACAARYGIASPVKAKKVLKEFYVQTPLNAILAMLQ
jgi:molybdopterin converting factor small subunit